VTDELTNAILGIVYPTLPRYLKSPIWSLHREYRHGGGPVSTFPRFARVMFHLALGRQRLLPSRVGSSFGPRCGGHALHVDLVSSRCAAPTSKGKGCHMFLGDISGFHCRLQHACIPRQEAAAAVCTMHCTLRREGSHTGPLWRPWGLKECGQKHYQDGVPQAGTQIPPSECGPTASLAGIMFLTSPPPHATGK
jgi:hypothetical protein